MPNKGGAMSDLINLTIILVNVVVVIGLVYFLFKEPPI